MRNNQDGWILVDSLVCMTILATALMLYAGMFYFSNSSTYSETNYKTAVTLAQQEVETLQKYDGAAKSSNSSYFSTLQSSSNGIFTITPTLLTITNIDSAHALYPVQINVTWSEEKRQNSSYITVNKSVILTTYYYLNPNS
jgi:uncharacterized protein (UPF0333 family)